MMDDLTSSATQRHSFVLHPYRSLSVGGFLVLMALYGGVSFMAGLYFLSLGAWPITGFLGVDVLLLYLAFRASYRAARKIETIEIGDGHCEVTACDGGGRQVNERFQSYWLRVELTELASGGSQLRLTSRGRALVVGRFLSEPERRELAVALRSALAR
jgi:uncharacterized membrane protein